MAEKKLQENPLPDDPKSEPEKCKDMGAKSSDKVCSPAAPVTTNLPVQVSIPSFTKASPNDLYRRWLPAVLFLLTFVTVMTILLIYMDTVALGAQQFRLNMSRDYELARIGQESAALVAYVRQLHLAPRAPRPAPPPPARTPRVDVLDRLLGEVYNGTFVEFLEAGARLQTTLYLEWARQWGGVAVRAAPRDFLALRGPAMALHACLSPSTHPREVIEYQTTDMAARNKTTDFLLKHNYFVAANFTDGIMYALNQTNISD